VKGKTAKLAQQRPTVRTHYVAASPPPLSPRTPSERQSEKKHHSRKKSGGHGHGHDKKTSRPTPLTRRTTPQYTPRANAGRTRDHDDAARDSGESFPQYWYVIALFLLHPFHSPGQDEGEWGSGTNRRMGAECGVQF